MINIYIIGISAILTRTDPRTHHLYYKSHDKFHWSIISCGIVIYLIYPKYYIRNYIFLEWPFLHLAKTIIMTW